MTSLGEDEFAPFVLRCDPAADNPCGMFGGDPCCSDDPAAIDPGDLEAFVIPAYEGRGGVGTPVFSAGNNPLSRSGYCLAEQTPPEVALVDLGAEGCRVPCNPTWSDADIKAICGPNALCCQTVALQPTDCIYDPSLGDSGCFRPVTGNDITGLGGANATNWANSDHATHQDPSGLNCNTWADGVSPSLPDFSVDELRSACYRRLTVANQRGSCFSGTELASCPYEAVGYVDVCEQQNIDNQLGGCN